MNCTELTQFEQYLIKKEGYSFNLSYEIVMFVKKLNDYIVKYYIDSIYSYILKNEQSTNRVKVYDNEKFNQLLKCNANNSIYTSSFDYNNNEYISYLFSNLLEFISVMNIDSYNKESIICMARENKIASVINYSECILATKELYELQTHNIYKLVFEIEREMLDPKYDFVCELSNFIDRLINHYSKSKNIKRLERARDLKDLINLID